MAKKATKAETETEVQAEANVQTPAEITTIEREDGTIRTDMIVEGKAEAEVWKQDNDNG